MRVARRSAIAVFAFVATGFAGCGALIGLDGIDHVACVGSECAAPNTPGSESGVEGSAEGSAPGEDGGEDSGPIPMKDASMLADGATCNPFVCPNGSDLCDWFDGTAFGSWNSKPGSAVTDTAMFPLTPCGAPSSVRVDAPAGAASMFSKSLPQKNVTLDVDVLPHLAAWNKNGIAVFVSFYFVSSCGSPDTNVTISARTDGIWAEACPGPGCSTCAVKNLGALPPDTWQHLQIKANFVGSVAMAVTFGAITGTLNFETNTTSAFGLTMKVGADARNSSGAFTASYDNLALDLK